MNRLTHFLRLLILIALPLGTLPFPRATRAQDGDSATLAFFTPVSGTLDDATPVEQYTFEGQAEQVIALLAVTLEGDLDPVLQVIGPDGTLVAENDDLDSLVRDAGLEALVLPAGGSYTVRVMRYEGVNGSTSGTYELTLTPGFAQVELREPFDVGAVSWVTAAGEPLLQSGGGLRLRADEPGVSVRAFPPEMPEYRNLFMRADVRLFGIMPYAEFGLVLRAQGEDRARAYVVKLNTEGQWSVALEDETGEFVLRSWGSHAALNADAWEIAVLAREDRFDVYANGALLGSVTDSRLTGAGTVGLFARMPETQSDPVTVIVDNIMVTTRLGTTYAGLPLALNTWDSPDPDDLIAELAASGQIDPAVAYDLFLPDKALGATDPDAQFELIGTDQAIYTDFVLSAWVNIATQGRSNGCGLVYRWQDDRNFDLAYVDTSGGFGVVEARDGAVPVNVYDFSEMVRTDEPEHVLVLVQGAEVALYLNGALVTQERIEPAAGRVGVALLNYEDVPTDCFWTNIWVWEVE